MTCHSLPARVRLIIAERLKVDPANVIDAARLRQDLGAGDLDIVEISFSIEEAADNEATDEQAESLKTVGDCIRLAEQLADEMAGAA